MVIVSENEIREELDHSLSEWGLAGGKLAAGESTNKAHEKYRRSIIAEGIAMRTRGLDRPLNFAALRSNSSFPKDMQAAYEYVLRHDHVGSPIYASTSDIDVSGAPFNRWYRNNRVVRYQRKLEFKGLPLSSLDPLHRFKFEQISEAELVFNQWFVDDDPSGDQGIVMEAILACHAIHHEACFHCKCRNSLRWNGGGKSSWQDLVCIQCECFYEVKTKKDMDKIARSLKFNRIQGGSFVGWCMLNNSKRSDQKVFLVLLPRNATMNRKSEKVFPVQAVEIGKVLPNASHQTFNTKLKSIRLQSQISVNAHTLKHWFALPTPKNRVHLMPEEKEEIYVDRFSREDFDTFTKKYFPSKAEETLSSASLERDPFDVASLLENVPDDWEDLLSDSE